MSKCQEIHIQKISEVLKHITPKTNWEYNPFIQSKIQVSRQSETGFFVHNLKNNENILGKFAANLNSFMYMTI